MKLKNILRNLWKYFSEKGRILDEVARSKAIELVEHELSETEHVFAILSFGAFVGLPAPPMQIMLDLLPLSEYPLTGIDSLQKFIRGADKQSVPPEVIS